MRITPYYEQKGIKNPYYVLSPTVVNGTISALKKQGDEYKNIKATDILFRNVEPNQLNGSIIYKATAASGKVFQITDKQKKIYLSVLQPQLKKYMYNLTMEWYLEKMQQLLLT